MQLFCTGSPEGHPPGALFCYFPARLPAGQSRRDRTLLLGLLGSWLTFIFSSPGFTAEELTRLSCNTDRIDERATVERLYDGDTVKLRDGRKIRFIGIDTPEMGHRGTSSQPLASAARDMLQTLLEKSNYTVSLRYDAEPHDRYARNLAHVYLSDGSSVAAHLLERGLATLLPIPPNVWNLPCYQATEQRARMAQRGLWALPEYQPIDATQLRPDDTGLRLVSGKVTASHLRKGVIWLTLNDAVLLHIGQRDRKYFPDTFPAELLGHSIIARGRVYFTEGTLRMQIRHPATIQGQGMQ